VRSIQAKIELEGTPINVSGATFPLESEYRVAYRAAYDAAKAATPTAPEADLRRTAREAGRRRVVQGFMNGEVTVSIPPNPTYPVYYGQEWDRAHGH
jgi:hypothetical protein